jgi:hypothetical protein
MGFDCIGENGHHDQGVKASERNTWRAHANHKHFLLDMANLILQINVFQKKSVEIDVCLPGDRGEALGLSCFLLGWFRLFSLGFAICKITQG